MRFDIISKEQKSLESLQKNILRSGHRIESLVPIKSYWIDKPSYTKDQIERIEELLKNPIDEELFGREVKIDNYDFNYLIQVSFKPGVTDNTAHSLKETLSEIFDDTNIKVSTGKSYLLRSHLHLSKIQEIANEFLGNELIQSIKVYSKDDVSDYIPSPEFPNVRIKDKGIRIIDLGLSDEALLELSEKNIWALSTDEIQHIKAHYSKEETKDFRVKNQLPVMPTDVEIEVIAQSWSEHCKHKIFTAHIDYTESEGTQNKIGEKKVLGIFPDYIKRATRDVKEKFNKDWLISVFSDNAGIIRFGDKIDYCLKVETHNSPSALDPYGGALTGILGVNRDILGCGIGAEPIANMNVLCFAPPNYPKSILQKLPTMLKHPKTILHGVHKGIEDGGNKSGIPTVNGSLHFHDNYAGKPLVYCGTIGALPQILNHKETHLKNQMPGDLVVVCGGSVGSDGIHGATFSSVELNEKSPATAVQIGDPFTQKRMTDFIIEARDLDLYSSITDNGAGGLSSSIGEMACGTNGATINLDLVPLKYSGLSPFEIVISESQERMSLSVPPNKINEFLLLAEKRNCQAVVIGDFHDRGSFDIYSKNELVASLDLDFLHESLPPMKLKAHFDGVKTDELWHGEKNDEILETFDDSIRTVLSFENVKSKESLVRQFDHEVKGATLVKPFVQKELIGPSDAAVLWGKMYGDTDTNAISLSHGLCPQLSHLDTYYMTQVAIDEAIRNAVSSGANPNFVALCDNYCWPDPIESVRTPDGQHKLAQLVRSGQALYDCSLAYQSPFISGKDSMKNDFVGVNSSGEKIKISVPPTLLITAIAKVDHIQDRMTTDFKEAGDLIYYIGPTLFSEIYYSTYFHNHKKLAPINCQNNFKRYNTLHSMIKKKLIQSCHDISDGGMITAAIESAFPSNFGIQFKTELIAGSERLDALLFNEIPGAFIISINPECKQSLESHFKNEFKYLGVVTMDNQIRYNDTINLTTKELYNIWSNNEY